MHFANLKTEVYTPDPRWGSALPLAAVQEIDRHCEQFERALQTSEAAKIEDHLDGVVEPERSALLRELLALELEYRAKRVGLAES